MFLRLDTTSTAPIYAQIAAAIRRAIAGGELARGDRLPPARELARALGVNMHTVLRAFAVLRDEGTLEMRRGRGAVVVSDAVRSGLVRLVGELVSESRRAGMDAGEVLALVEEELR
jgi:GntR family transcriptional regulator